MRELQAALIVASLVLAGCVGTTEDGSDLPDADGTDPELAETSEIPGADGLAGRQPVFGDPVNVTKDKPGAEPMIDLAPDGTIYLTGTGPGSEDAPLGLYAAVPTQPVFRSTDDGQTWTEVTPAVLTAGRTGVDNALAVGGDGTVYYANAAGSTLQVYRSTDAGDSWLPAATVPVPTPMHRTWFVPEGETTIHLAVESLPATRNWHHVSTDSGTTWGPPTPIHHDPGFGSDLAIGPDGTLYLARTSIQSALPGVEPGWDLLVSADGGITWDRREMFDRTGDRTGSWQSLEVGPDGTIYMVWAQMENGTSLVHYAYSTDGEAWSTPRPITEVDGSQTLPWMDVRGPGALGVVWYAADEPGRPGEIDAPWHVDYAFVDDADTPSPSVHRTRVTDAPVHEGSICTSGPFCRGDRDLFDFTWVAFGPEGRAHLAYASTMWDNPSAFPVYAGEAESFPTDASDSASSPKD